MKKIFVLFSFSLCFSLSLSFSALSQVHDTTFYDETGRKANSLHDAATYKIVTKNWSAHPTKDGVDWATEKVYYRSGQIAMQKTYSYYSKGIADGETKKWYKSGQLKAVIDYKDDSLSGDVTTYWPNGKLRRQDRFDNGKFISGQCYDSTGNKVPHYDFETRATFVYYRNDVYRYLNEHIKYPREARNAGIGGNVSVSFVIEADGSVSHIKMVQSTGDRDADSAILDAFTLMPPWQPGTEEGEPTRFRYELPIKVNPGW